MKLLIDLQLWWERRRQKRMIAAHGWTGVYVGDYRSAPTWAYTIGFDETLDHPELVVFDLPPASANELFAQAFEELRAGALTIEDGMRWPADSDMPGVWRKVHPDQLEEWLFLACLRRFDRTASRFGLEAFQFVLSDKGAMPWDDGYDERLRERQAALYLPLGQEFAAVED